MPQNPRALLPPAWSTDRRKSHAPGVFGSLSLGGAEQYPGPLGTRDLIRLVIKMTIRKETKLRRRNTVEQQYISK